MKKERMDMQLLISVILLTSAGFLIFLSASLGLLARDSVHFGSIAFKQICFGLVPGIAALYFTSRTNYMRWRNLAFWIFVSSVVLNLIIFIPGIGLNVKGATRWLLIGSFSFQVSEALKIGAILYFAAWLSSIKEQVQTFKWGFLPLAGMLGVVGTLLLIQPDTDTFIVTAVALVAMYLVAGGSWKHMGIIAIMGVMCFGALAYQRPYVMARLTAFMHPTDKSLTTGYQAEQSLIAIGSGGVFGRGFGQSLQKFNYLPEPVGDSIFAVAAEEFGLLGSLLLICLFVFFSVRCFKIAVKADHTFGGLVCIGIATFMIIQSYLNIGSMVGIVPLSGIPLLFVSQGGSALLFALAEAGIILNISRYAKAR